MVCVTVAAGEKLLLPPWLAATVQVPGVSAVTVEPLTLQTLSVLLLKVTGRLDVEDAVTVAVPFNSSVGTAPKLIVWLAAPTVML